ncbi:MAG: WbqC family protein [Sulfurimonas sp.]|jgi:hypothetical protein
MPKLSCHQPNYFSNNNYFEKIKQSDIFVLLDDVQFEKNGFTNRNRIPTKNGDLWFTIPIIHEEKQLIKDVKIAVDIWKEKHKRTIENIYGKSKFIEHFFDKESNYNYNSEKLIDWTWRSILFVMSELNKINNDCSAAFLKMKFSSELNINTTGTQRIIDICKYFKADTYLSGNGAKKYMDMELFEQNNIIVEFMPEKYEPYSILNTILK